MKCKEQKVSIMLHQGDHGHLECLSQINSKFFRKIMLIHLIILGTLLCRGKLGLHNNINNNLHKVGGDMVMETNNHNSLNNTNNITSSSTNSHFHILHLCHSNSKILHIRHPFH